MRRVIALASVALLLLAPATAADHAPDDQDLEFVLSGDEIDPASNVYTQYKEAHPSQEGSVTVTSCSTWVADEAADVDLTIPAQSVDYDINADLTAINGDRMQVAVGTYDDEAQEFVGQASSTGLIGTLDVPEFSVVQTEHLATQLCVQDADATSGFAVISAGQDGSSLVAYTHEDNPSYPTPEISTLVLSTIGMIALVGLARFRTDA